MPRKYTPRRRMRKRMYKRRRRAAAKTVVNRGIAPIAPRFITKLKYADEVQFSTTTGVPVYQNWNINSVFDPDRTGTGHQPMGFDQLSAIYDRYRVFAVSWNIDVVGSTTGDIPRLTVFPFDGAYTTTTRTTIMEIPRSYTKSSSFGDNKLSVRGRISLPRLRGQTSVEYKGDDSNAALCTANPADVCTLQCLVDSAAGTSTNCSALMSIRLIYHVEFYDPAALPVS